MMKSLEFNQKQHLLITISLVWLCVHGFADSTLLASKIVDVRTVDDRHLMITLMDGQILYKDDGQGKHAFMGHEHNDGDTVQRFDPPLDVMQAIAIGNWRIQSSTDPTYNRPLQPTHVFRMTKVNGTTWKWPEPDYTLEHTIFLRLPHPLNQGGEYTLSIDPAVQADRQSVAFTFDIFNSVSEAVHVNLIGYHPTHPIKSADLYMWLGDGGARNYSDYQGNRVWLYNVDTDEKHPVGEVQFWKSAGPDFGNWNLTASDVWNCDFSSFQGEGKFRLAIEGIGCSPEFEIRPDIYFAPFRKSVRGFFYMRIGMGREFSPVPRQPRFIPGVDPPGLKVYRTTMAPWHPQWKTLGGDPWDHHDWSEWKEPGEPTNPDAWGGHSDALDWDRHAGHISIVFDLLLPYLLSNGQIGDDHLDIAESGNGIPDIIDEALYEVDFWLRLRDGEGGYAFGLNNPKLSETNHEVIYQAAARPYMAWANAAMCAMSADCMRIAGNQERMEYYRDQAIEAWKFAAEQDLDFAFGIGNGKMRGRDLKMMAAASLYNVTGDRFYEDQMVKESVVKDSFSEIDRSDSHCQHWGVATYLMTAKHGWQPIHYPQLVAHMRNSIINEAKTKNLAGTENWPSRRSSDPAYGWFQSTIQTNPLIIAHSASQSAEEKELLLRAMILEADWSLGRNPLNMVLMTGLGSRQVEDIYTSGHNDGTPGVHPGHTPYMNAEPWGEGFMADPKGWYGSKGFPEWEKWPHGHALWRARYCYANNEFTPQQTMRGKMALYGYLYSLKTDSNH